MELECRLLLFQNCLALKSRTSIDNTPAALGAHSDHLKPKLKIMFKLAGFLLAVLSIIYRYSSELQIDGETVVSRLQRLLGY